MDFWSRLMSPLSTGTSRQDQAKDPAKRLHRFEKEYGHLLSTWRTSSNLSKDSDAAETLEIRLQELTNILSDESRRPLPHPCIQYASIKQIYVPIGKIATTSYNEWIIKEAVLFFATLIESEEEAFVENTTFAASLTNLLVRITGVNSVRLGLDTESRVVELAFNITTKIRLEPQILPSWFKMQHSAAYQHHRTVSQDSRERFAGRTQRADFPLFYILMDYIHHEGKVGDFARTGLLYVIEAASSSADLEQWIVESDLSTLMATGLGALYSQLSRKLVIDHPPHDLPPILALSDYEHPATNYEIISSCSAEFQSHLETFLSHLLFWQDVLNHCRSLEVKSTLLEHFQIIFLQQLLYPSLLESSDIDGGSSVAVLTYLRRILESLDHPDMINLILHYLLALPDNTAIRSRSSRTSVSDARRRKSIDLATMMKEKSDLSATPLLFNLVDLILACLRSRNQQTIHVTLQLVSAILKRHHRYAVITLLSTEVLPSRTVHRTVGAHEQEIEYLITLAGAIGGQGDFDAMYSSILRDTTARLESHACSLKLVAPKVSTNNHKLPGVPDSLPGAPRDVREHTLRVDDPLLNSILNLLETFFVNPVETNLSVTETVVDLAICGYMSIEGWLARDPSNYTYAEDAEEARARVNGEPENETANKELEKETANATDDQKEEKENGNGNEGANEQNIAEEGGDEEGQDQESKPEQNAGDEDVANGGEKQEQDSEEKQSHEQEGDEAGDVAVSSPLSEDQELNFNTETEAESQSTAESKKLAAMERCRLRPEWKQESVPRILEILKHLCSQVTRYKETVPRFEELLQQRREAFQTADSILDNSAPVQVATPPPQQGTPERPSLDEVIRTGSPSKPSALEGLAHRLLSELGTPSRSGSPRGRKEPSRSSGTSSPASAAGPELLTPKAIPIPPKEFPLNYNETPRAVVGGSRSPTVSSRDGSRAPFDERQPTATTQAAAFAAMDQSILSKHVGLPDDKLKPIPLRLDKKTTTAGLDTIDQEDEGDSGDEAAISDTDTIEYTQPGTPAVDTTVSVSHVITNVIIFQSFLLELASLMQVRAGLFDEVRFV